MLYLLDVVRNGIRTPNMRLTFTLTLFIAKAALQILKPGTTNRIRSTGVGNIGAEPVRWEGESHRCNLCPARVRKEGSGPPNPRNTDQGGHLRAHQQQTVNTWQCQEVLRGLPWGEIQNKKSSAKCGSMCNGKECLFQFACRCIELWWEQIRVPPRATA